MIISIFSVFILKIVIQVHLIIKFLKYMELSLTIFFKLVIINIFYLLLLMLSPLIAITIK